MYQLSFLIQGIEPSFKYNAYTAIRFKLFNPIINMCKNKGVAILQVLEGGVHIFISMIYPFQMHKRYANTHIQTLTQIVLALTNGNKQIW